MQIRFFLLLFIFLSLTGCGKKTWPQPIADEEYFFLQKTVVQAVSGKLQIITIVSGNTNNIDHFVLEIAYDDCPNCPFQPQESRTYFLSSPDMKKENNQITLTLSTPQKPSRLRLVGYNRYRQFSPQFSPVCTVFKEIP